MIQLSQDLIQRYHDLIETLGPETLKAMLQEMHLIRAFEERAEQLYMQGKVHGTMHLVDANNLGANGIVAGGIPIAVGVGLSIKMRRTNQVCLVIFGDGAANEGAFHEALNMASIWTLPIVFLCENNQYAMSMPVQKAFNIENISQRAAAYGLPGITVDGNDPLAVYTAVSEAAARARRGEGATLVEAKTYRYKGHSKSDKQAYRSREEVRFWQENRDPIMRFSQLLVTAGLISEAEAAQMRERAIAIIDEAVAFSEASPAPDVADIMDGVYA
jgi:TPP-dependent pyruvate/acetoin dehydrogenase alpha subunit